MTHLDSATATSALMETVHGKLQSAPSPLPLSNVVKGLPRPRKMKAAEFQNEVQSILDEQVRLGLLFRCPSGKNGNARYWSRDEKHHLREKALELASRPQTMAAMKTKLKKEVKGVEATFLQTVIEELVAEGRLFQHPAKTAKGGPLIGATPPPPPLAPLEQPKNAKVLSKIVADCRKLLASSKVSVDQFMRSLQRQLLPPPDTKPNIVIAETTSTQPTDATQPARAELDQLILKAVADVPVLSLAELRASMPAEYRGTAFDESILRLADAQQVILSQDALPARFSDAEKAQFVRDGEALFTTISQWS